jgi:chromosome segregation ATPase
MGAAVQTLDGTSHALASSAGTVQDSATALREQVDRLRTLLISWAQDREAAERDKESTAAAMEALRKELAAVTQAQQQLTAAINQQKEGYETLLQGARATSAAMEALAKGKAEAQGTLEAMSKIEQSSKQINAEMDGSLTMLRELRTLVQDVSGALTARLSSASRSSSASRASVNGSAAGVRKDRESDGKSGRT